MTAQRAATTPLNTYVWDVVRDTHTRLKGVQNPDMAETADALGVLAAHLAAPWYVAELPGGDEGPLLDHLRQEYPEQDVHNGMAIAKFEVTEADIPASPFPTRGRSENLRRGRPDRKRAAGAVNVPHGASSEDPRRWRTISLNRWIGLLLKDPDVGQTMFAVAVAVGYHSNWKTGAGAFASRKTIGEEMRISPRQVSRHVTALVEAGWLRDTGRRHGEGGSIEYHLSTPAIADKPPEAFAAKT